MYISVASTHPKYFYRITFNLCFRWNITLKEDISGDLKQVSSVHHPLGQGTNQTVSIKERKSQHSSVRLCCVSFEENRLGPPLQSHSYPPHLTSFGKLAGKRQLYVPSCHVCVQTPSRLKRLNEEKPGGREQGGNWRGYRKGGDMIKWYIVNERNGQRHLMTKPMMVWPEVVIKSLPFFFLLCTKHHKYSVNHFALAPLVPDVHPWHLATDYDLIQTQSELLKIAENLNLKDWTKISICSR